MQKHMIWPKEKVYKAQLQYSLTNFLAMTNKRLQTTKDFPGLSYFGALLRL